VAAFVRDLKRAGAVATVRVLVAAFRRETGCSRATAYRAVGWGPGEDRVDIVFEARDATGFLPSGQKPWWEELPPAARSEWASRATRRTARDRPERIRVAFVASKFRDDDEPAPFVLEVDFTAEPWAVRDVTLELIAVGDAARATELAQVEASREGAAEALVVRRSMSSPPSARKILTLNPWSTTGDLRGPCASRGPSR
jgi:hypothetical protein